MFELMDCVLRQHQERMAPKAGDAEEDMVDVLLRLEKEDDLEAPTMGAIKSIIRVSVLMYVRMHNQPDLENSWFIS